jgi:hypothetical protein
MRLTPELLPMLLRSCQLTLLTSLSFGAVLAVFSAPVTAQTTHDSRTTIPNLSRYDDETRRTMELACISERGRGPVAYAECLNRQIASLQNSPRIPSLSRYDDGTRRTTPPASKSSGTNSDQSRSGGSGVISAIADDTKVVGNWLVSDKEDRFEDGGRFFAITGDGAGNLFAVRCLEKALSLGIGGIDDATRKYKVGDKFYIKLRVDKQPVLELAGVAISESLVQVDVTADIVRSIRDGKEIAVRQENSQGVSDTANFNTKGNAKAFARLTKECKVN